MNRIRALGFRNLGSLELELGTGITLLWGPNGAGKTNVVEAICMALAGRSCRTSSDREVIGFGGSVARVELEVSSEEQRTEVLWSLDRAGERRHVVDGNPVTAQPGPDWRPALTIFLPDSLGLVKGPPSPRRAHLDRLCAALWPARSEARRRYGRALAQRNALLGRVRAGAADAGSLDAWEAELGAAGVELIATRLGAVKALAVEFSVAAAELGLPGASELRYVPRSEATDAATLTAELRSRRQTDIARGHTAHGPHLDDLAISADGRALRRYGSQGEQRVALLALLFAERRAFLEARRAPPLMLLDDVMSELDPQRRSLLTRRLEEGGGQAVVTATEPGHLPLGRDRLEVHIERGEASAPPAEGVLREDPVVLSAGG